MNAPPSSLKASVRSLKPRNSRPLSLDDSSVYEVPTKPGPSFGVPSGSGVPVPIAVVPPTLPIKLTTTVVGSTAVVKNFWP